MDLTSVATGIYMLIWDGVVIDKMTGLKIRVKVYKRYVDDITIAMPEINIGWYYDTLTNKMCYDPQHPYGAISPTVGTYTIVGDIVNSIDKDIQVTFDCPELNSNGKVPVLDIEMWMEGNLISHVFYRKPIASKYLIMQRSAMSKSTKRNTLFQEGLKRVTYTRGVLFWQIGKGLRGLIGRM